MILQPCNVELTKVHYYDNHKRSQNMSVSTISREMCQNSFNKNVIIKKNFLGHRWVLKINELEEDPKKKKYRKLKMAAYILMIFSLFTAVFFGIIFSLDQNIFRVENKNTPNKENEKNYGGDGISSVKNYTKMFPTNNIDGGRNTSLRINSLPNISAEIMSKSHLNMGNSSEEKKYVEKVYKWPNNTKKSYCRNCTEQEVCIKIEETDKPKCVRMLDNKDPTGCGGLCKLNTEYCKNLDKNDHVYQCLTLKNLLKCPEGSFSCGYMCIPARKRCDEHTDCINMLDEKDCVARCGENQVPCLNGHCIHKEKMCNKVFDCQDKSDEPVWCQQIKYK